MNRKGTQPYLSKRNLGEVVEAIETDAEDETDGFRAGMETAAERIREEFDL